MSENIINKIEKPLKNLIKILRDNGFNTFCSCGHLPNPYIQMEFHDDTDFTKLYTLLIESGYVRFELKAYWDTISNRRSLEVVFCPSKKLAKLGEIKEK